MRASLRPRDVNFVLCGMLCRVLMERLPEHVAIVYLSNPSLSREDILYAIADELSLTLPEHMRPSLNVTQSSVRRWRVWIKDYGDSGRLWSKFVQQLETLWIQRPVGKAHASQIAARPAQVRDEAAIARIVSANEDNRDRCRRGFC